MVDIGCWVGPAAGLVPRPGSRDSKADLTATSPKLLWQTVVGWGPATASSIWPNWVEGLVEVGIVELRMDRFRWEYLAEPDLERFHP